VTACPRCAAPLDERLTEVGIAYICPKCQGRMVGMPVLRNAGAGEGFLRDLAGRQPSPPSGPHKAMMVTGRERACRIIETRDNQSAEAHGGRGQGHLGNPGLRR